MSKLDKHLKPGVTRTDFWITLASGLITTTTACLGLLTWEWAAILITVLTSVWTGIRSHLKSRNDGTNTLPLLLAALIALPLASCSTGANHIVTFTGDDYSIKITRQGDQAADSIVILPSAK